MEFDSPMKRLEAAGNNVLHMSHAESRAHADGGAIVESIDLHLVAPAAAGDTCTHQLESIGASDAHPLLLISIPSHR